MTEHERQIWISVFAAYLVQRQMTGIATAGVVHATSMVDDYVAEARGFADVAVEAYQRSQRTLASGMVVKP